MQVVPRSFIFYVRYNAAELRRCLRYTRPPSSRRSPPLTEYIPPPLPPTASRGNPTIARRAACARHRQSSSDGPLRWYDEALKDIFLIHMTCALVIV